MLPLSLMVRTSPESVGLLPDGDRPDDPELGSSARGSAIINERSFTRSEALHSKSFWLLSLALVLAVIGLPGYQAHWVPYFEDIEFSRGMAATALTVFGMFSIAARFVWGYLSTRHDIRSLMVVQAALAAIGIVFILTVQNNVMLFAWAVYQGLTLAVFFQLQALLVVNTFGRAHIGAIRGVMFPFITLGSASGPMIIGALRDWLGSYNIPFMMVIITWILAGIVVYMAKPPKADPSSESIT